MVNAHFKKRMGEDIVENIGTVPDMPPNKRDHPDLQEAAADSKSSNKRQKVNDDGSEASSSYGTFQSISSDDSSVDGDHEGGGDGGHGGHHDGDCLPNPPAVIHTDGMPPLSSITPPPELDAVPLVTPMNKPKSQKGAPAIDSLATIHMNHPVVDSPNVKVANQDTQQLEQLEQQPTSSSPPPSSPQRSRTSPQRPIISRVEDLEEVGINGEVVKIVEDVDEVQVVEQPQLTPPELPKESKGNRSQPSPAVSKTSTVTSRASRKRGKQNQVLTDLPEQAVEEPLSKPPSPTKAKKAPAKKKAAKRKPTKAAIAKAAAAAAKAILEASPEKEQPLSQSTHSSTKSKEKAAKTPKGKKKAAAAKAIQEPSTEKEQPLSQSTHSSAKSKEKVAKTPKGKKKAAVASEEPAVSQSSEKSKTIKAAAKPTKKKKKITFQDELLRYMFGKAQPCNIKQICEATRGGDTAVNFCMLSLVDKQWIMKKEFVSGKAASGRTKELYWPNLSAVSKSKELQQALGVTSVTGEEVRGAVLEQQKLQEQVSLLQRELNSVLAQPSNTDLTAQIAQGEQEIAEMEGRLKETLDRINGSDAPAKTKLGQKPKPRPSQKRLKKQINTMRSEWKKRKDKCMDFLDQLADGMEKKVKDVVKLLEVETDEMAKAVMPPKYVVEDETKRKK